MELLQTSGSLTFSTAGIKVWRWSKHFDSSFMNFLFLQALHLSRPLFPSPERREEERERGGMYQKMQDGRRSREEEEIIAKALSEYESRAGGETGFAKKEKYLYAIQKLERE